MWRRRRLLALRVPLGSYSLIVGILSAKILEGVVLISWPSSHARETKHPEIFKEPRPVWVLQVVTSLEQKTSVDSSYNR
ncbi:hypothetical protein SISSUDRAFT_1043522 [Sistotremastrum suecicum HHB10207 ss-3]|uniref:Uncharacterized protein n=1 Tax=Sistotremastrum suecicum HHB10207 ss-3 TaxID=1314776 RepID=A0A166FTP4_9AGAM|nr:hypothetical protein SISSUDRAFT_1043522 [Sistotremastrum suecicum HHB10207 ss-3]